MNRRSAGACDTRRATCSGRSSSAIAYRCSGGWRVRASADRRDRQAEPRALPLPIATAASPSSRAKHVLRRHQVPMMPVPDGGRPKDAIKVRVPVTSSPHVFACDCGARVDPGVKRTAATCAPSAAGGGVRLAGVDLRRNVDADAKRGFRSRPTLGIGEAVAVRMRQAVCRRDGAQPRRAASAASDPTAALQRCRGGNSASPAEIERIARREAGRRAVALRRRTAPRRAACRDAS